MYDSNTRINYILGGGTPEPIKLYPETQEILNSFQTPANPEGWNRLGMDEEFDTLEDAESTFYKWESEYIEYIKCRRANQYGV